MAVTDDFNRPDGGMGSNWTAAVSTAEIVDNACMTSNLSTTVHLYWAAATNTFNDNQTSEVLIQQGDTAYFGGVSVRMTGTAGTTCGYYVVYGNGGAVGLIIRRVDNGADTDLADDGATYVPTAGDEIRLDATGTTLTVYVNDVSALSTTDATYSSGQPGMYFFDTTALVAYDQWTGTGEVAGDPQPSRMLFLGVN